MKITWGAWLKIVLGIITITSVVGGGFWFARLNKPGVKSFLPGFTVTLGNALTVVLWAIVALVVVAVVLVVYFGIRFGHQKLDQHRNTSSIVPLPINEHNAYGALYRADMHAIVQAQNGALPDYSQKVPTNYSPHITYQNDVKEWTKAMEAMGRTSVVETDSHLLLPGRCDFNEVLMGGFRPSPEQIFLGYLPGGDPVTSTLEVCAM